VVEERQAAVEQVLEKGIEVILGNAAQPGMLDAANVTAARFLISAIPNPFEAGNLIERARAANPQLEIIARAHSDAEVDYLAKLGASRIIMGEREIARGISEYILSRLGAAPPETSDQAAQVTAPPVQNAYERIATLVSYDPGQERR
jgi:CPA2 family monovalent cation:H+ antiporter-2